MGIWFVYGRVADSYYQVGVTQRFVNAKLVTVWSYPNVLQSSFRFDAKWNFVDLLDNFRIKNKFGAFHYSPFRAPYDPKDPYSPEKYR